MKRKNRPRTEEYIKINTCGVYRVQTDTDTNLHLHCVVLYVCYVYVIQTNMQYTQITHTTINHNKRMKD